MITATLRAAFHLRFHIDDECGCPHPHDILFEIPGLEMTPEQIVDVIENGVVGSEYQWEIAAIPDIAKSLRRAADPKDEPFMISEDASPCTILWGCEESPREVDVAICIDYVSQLIWIDAESYAILDFWKHTEEVIKLLEHSSLTSVKSVVYL